VPFPPKEQIASLNWPEIRRLHEVEGLSIRELARRFNIASPTTVQRRAKAEKWSQVRASFEQYKPPPRPLPDQVDDVDLIPAAAIVAPHTFEETAAQIQAEAGNPGADGIASLAALYSDRIREQFEIGRRVTAIGMRVLETVGTFLHLNVARQSG
jgi:hypothetical protein